MSRGRLVIMSKLIGRILNWIALALAAIVLCFVLYTIDALTYSYIMPVC